MAEKLLLNGVGILVVSLSHAFPFSVHFQQKQHIGEVNAIAPALFQHSDHGQRFLHQQHVYPSFEMVASGDGVYIVVKLFNGAVFQCSVQIAE